MIIVFDFDGVLVDTLRECNASYNLALREHRLKPLSLEEFFKERRTVVQAIDFFSQYFLRLEGKAYTHENLRTCFEKNKEKILALRKAYHCNRDAILEEQYDQNPVYDGVAETLEKLQSIGTRMAVVSARDDSSLKKYLKAKKLHGFFEKVVGSSAFFAQSHKLKVLQLEALNENEIWFVDDMPAVLESIKGRARLFYASWGYGILPTGAEGITVLKKPHDLIRYVIKK